MSRPSSVPHFDTRRTALAALLGAGVLVLLLVVSRSDSLGSWLLWRYLRAALLAGVFGLACLVAGHALVLRAVGQLPLAEHVALALPVGVLAFFSLSFAFGLLGLYGAGFFWACPAILIALGAAPATRSWSRWRRHSWRLAWPLEPSQVGVLLLGLLGIGLLWFPLLSPQNASYDARWYHLPIAQHYLARGGIEAFQEGWVPGALPQLWSVLGVWAWATPGTQFDRIETLAHIELLLFITTLVGVAALARRVAGRRVPGAWAALFLFPGIFCYDSSLVLGADHVAACFVPAIALLSLRHLRTPSLGQALLLGAVLAGLLLTKYTAVIALPLPLAAVSARLARDLRAGDLRRGVVLGGAFAASALLLTAPHWLKNWAFYGDPLFPLLRAWLPSQPWSVAAEAPHQTWFSLAHPKWGFVGALETLRTLVTFSFVPHDFPQYHRDLPVFGSLFTLLTPALLLLRPRRDLLWLFAGTYLGIAAWVWVHQLDRYLQVLVPWMAAGVAGVLQAAWREGGLVRWGAGGLVAIQLAWGASVPFIPAHRAAGGAIQHTVVDLLSARYRGADQLATYPEWQRMGRALPAGAKVLVHEEEIHLGIEAQTALDYSGDQGALYWGEPGAATPTEIWQKLRAHGVTHVIWADKLDHGTDTVAAGLAFFDFAVNHTRRLGTYGGFVLAELPSAPPAASPPSLVAYYPCESGAAFEPGLYGLTELARAAGDRRPRANPRPTKSPEQAMANATFVVWETKCRGPLPDNARAGFELLAARGQAMLLRRKRP